MYKPNGERPGLHFHLLSTKVEEIKKLHCMLSVSGYRNEHLGRIHCRSGPEHWICHYRYGNSPIFRLRPGTSVVLEDPHYCSGLLGSVSLCQYNGNVSWALNWLFSAVSDQLIYRNKELLDCKVAVKSSTNAPSGPGAIGTGLSWTPSPQIKLENAVCLHSAKRPA